MPLAAVPARQSLVDRSVPQVDRFVDGHQTVIFGCEARLDARHWCRRGGSMARQGSTDERLARVPLFEGLSRKQLSQISSLMTEVEIEAGKVLARQGEIGREFLILLEGEVEVARDGKVIATRSAGDYVGEIALLDERPRTATVTAKTDVVAEVLNRAEFSTLLADSPDLSNQVMATVAGRLAELDSQWDV
jgi:signal-transduction protein with cAMP-binding, CBS, and nucleotidyltransferase domain